MLIQRRTEFTRDVDKNDRNVSSSFFDRNCCYINLGKNWEKNDLFDNASSHSRIGQLEKRLYLTVLGRS